MARTTGLSKGNSVVGESGADDASYDGPSRHDNPILAAARGVLLRVYSEEQILIVDLQVVVIGLAEVPASPGTAAGFIGLGLASALNEMIADTAAGVYLLRDPEFNIGDSVDTASVSGTIRRIDPCKTRIEADNGDLIVLANRDVEKKWVQEPPGSEGKHSTT